MASRTRSWLALGALLVVGLGGYELFGLATAPSRLPPRSPDDDLEMLATLTDAAATAAPSLMAMAEDGRVFVTRGKTGLVEVTPRAGDAGRSHLAPLGEPIAGLAVSGDALWASAGHAVWRLPFDGGSAVLVSDALAHPRSLAVDGRSVIVVDVDTATPGLLRASRVVRLSRAAGSQPAILGRYEGEISNVVLDHGAAYWADRLEGSILAAAEDATEPTVLTTSRGLPGQVAVVGDTLVWVEKRSESLFAIPKAGGTPRLLVQDFAGFAHVTARTGHVAWVNEAAVEGTFRVLEVPIEGGEPVAVSPAVPSVEALASDGVRLYWMRDGEVAEVGKSD